jgi:integrase
MTDKTFDDAFDLLELIQLSKAPNTIAQTKANIKHLRPWFKKNCPLISVFETSHEETWSAYKYDQKKIAEAAGKKRMLGHDRRTLLMALKRAEKKGWVKKVFSKADLELKEFSKPIGKHISEEDTNKLGAYLLKHCVKTYLQFQMALTMGLRMSEILQLKKEEVSLEKQELNLDPSRLKTRQPRKIEIPITDIVLPLLKERFDSAEGEYLFPSETHGVIDLKKPQSDNSYHWTKARLATGVKCRFHDLRHSCLSNALANGMQPLTASKYFGCTQEVLNRVYDHIRLKDKILHRDILNGKKKASHG